MRRAWLLGVGTERQGACATAATLQRRRRLQDGGSHTWGGRHLPEVAQLKGPAFPPCGKSSAPSSPAPLDRP